MISDSRQQLQEDLKRSINTEGDFDSATLAALRSHLGKLGVAGGIASGKTWRARKARAAAGTATEAELTALEARRARLREAGRKGGLARRKRLLKDDDHG